MSRRRHRPCASAARHARRRRSANTLCAAADGRNRHSRQRPARERRVDSRHRDEQIALLAWRKTHAMNRTWPKPAQGIEMRSEEHTSELQSLMRISYAVFCLKKKKTQHTTHSTQTSVT